MESQIAMDTLALLLVDTAAKHTVLLVLASIAAWLLQCTSSALRHSLWSLTMLSLMLLPFTSWTLPSGTPAQNTITGKVVNEKKLGIPGAEVALVAYSDLNNPRRDQGRVVASAVADALGHYSLRIPEAEIQKNDFGAVWARAPGHVAARSSWSTVIAALPDRKGTELVLTATDGTDIRMIDAAGIALAGVRVIPRPSRQHTGKSRSGSGRRSTNSMISGTPVESFPENRSCCRSMSQRNSAMTKRFPSIPMNPNQTSRHVADRSDDEASQRPGVSADPQAGSFELPP